MKQYRSYFEIIGDCSTFVVFSGLCQLFCTDITASSLFRGVLIYYSQDNRGCSCVFTERNQKMAMWETIFQDI